MTYRDDLEAATARKAALEHELRQRTHELDALGRVIDDLKTRARLPVLDNIRVAAPCSADWEAMTGDARVRACADCQQNVYNLSAMTRAEAEALIEQRVGRLCVRYYQRADGTILLADCEVGVKRRRRRRIAAVGVAASLAGAALAGARSTKTCDPTRPLMGAVAMPITHTAPAPASEPPQAEPRTEVKGELAAPDHVRATQGQVQIRHAPDVAPVRPAPDTHPKMGKLVMRPSLDRE